MLSRLLVLPALMLLGCPADDKENGEETIFEVEMTPEEEEPFCDAAGEDAGGQATVTIDADETSITVEMTFEGLSDEATSAHIHYGPPGEAGPAMFPLTPESPAEDVLTEEDLADTAPEEVATFAEAIEAIKAGDTYINIHTEACPQGEIRGQIE